MGTFFAKGSVSVEGFHLTTITRSKEQDSVSDMLKALSGHPRRGDLFGIAGMVAATTVLVVITLRLG
ncbi:MAG: hypothetical protein HOH74_04045 [Gemmatimonadetes bacterium]|nr:hypothetical protein [Gemmatimonadota bacterium]